MNELTLWVTQSSSIVGHVMTLTEFGASDFLAKVFKLTC